MFGYYMLRDVLRRYRVDDLDALQRYKLFVKGWLSDLLAKFST